MDRVIAHVDMDCFYCSCELKRDPTLKGKPVMVGGQGDRGVVSAANYEARRFGVFSATPGSRAKKLCPDGVFLPVDMKYYIEESQNVMEVLSSFTDIIQRVSVDEAYLDLSDLSLSFDSWADMGRYIKKTVKEQTGLTCSIGISNSRVVSKIASDHDKPDGLTIVTEARTFLAPLPIDKMPGIGKVSRKKYEEMGITTLGDLAGVDRFRIIEAFGMHGVRFQDIAQGKDRSAVKIRGKHKSISRERTFHQDEWRPETLRETIDNLSERVHKDLKKEEFKTVSVKIRYSDFSTITRDFTLPAPTRALSAIKEKAKTLFSQSVQANTAIRLLGVKLSKLTGNTDTQTTIDDYRND